MSQISDEPLADLVDRIVEVLRPAVAVREPPVGRSCLRPCFPPFLARIAVRTALLAALVLPHTVLAQSACSVAGSRVPVFEECPLWEFPFENRAEWLRFMAEGVSASDTAALAEAWTEEEFEGWRSGERGMMHRVSFRSDSLLIRGILARPGGTGPFPAVVYARGGNREYGRLRFLDVIRMLTIAEAGRVVLALEYRGEGGSEGEPELAAGDVDDLRSAAAVLRSWPLVDSEHIDVVGLSRGGLVAAWALVEPTPFRSAVLIAADLDLNDTAARRPELDEAVYRWSVPGYSEDRVAALRAHSPIHAIDKMARVPVLILHATDDVRIHSSVSLDFAARWTESGRPAGMVLFKSGGHALLAHAPAVRRELHSWLRTPSGPGKEKVGRGDLVLPRYGPTAATDGRWFYVYGGAPSGGRNGPDFMHPGLHASIERVDPVSLKSEYFSNGLHRRANHASVFSENSFVSCGGRSQVGLTRPKLRSCEILDLTTGIFKELPPLPEAVRTLGMAEVGGHLYVVGGVREGPGYSSGTFRLKEDRSAWERMADAPLGVSGQIVPFRQKLYVLGGYDGTAMSSVMVFDTETLQWERGQDLPYPLSAYSAVTDGTAIYLFGDYERMTAIHRYEPETGELYLLDLRITPRRHTAAVVIDGRVIVIGGNQTSAGMALTLIEAFELEALRKGGRLVSATKSLQAIAEE